MNRTKRTVDRTRERCRGEDGTVTAFVVIFTLALILLAGLVVDGGLTLAARVQAIDEAQAAARAGAQAIDLAAYRVVQESLTNVIKHAGPLARATVTITHEPDTLRISVRDDGVGADAAVVDGRGHGLHGMRERVAVHAGVLTAGPAPSGGFEVRASLPLPPNPPPNPSLNPPLDREEPA